MSRFGAFLAASALVSLALPSHAQERIERAPSAPVTVQLDSMPLGALATLLMRDVMRVPYVISADVLNDTRPISVNLVMPRPELPQRVVGFLRGVGLTVQLQGGTVYVSKGPMGPADLALAPGVSVPSGSPLAPSYGVEVAPEPVEPPTIAVIEPAHKPVLELAEVLDAILPELVIAARGNSVPQGSQIVDHFEPPALVVSGSAADVDRAVELVRLLDKPRPSVEIRAVVFEVRASSSKASALSLLAELGGIEIGSATGVPGEQFVRIAQGGLRAVLSATRGDGRFRVVAEPSLSALSGSVARLNAGSQVPTLGSVSYQDGAAVRSVVYRDSGVSLTVRPVVRGGEIELAVEQERSSFAKTTTGVDDSPTLNRSTASARVALRPGETVAIAGLDERASGDTRTGFLGGLLGAREKSSEQGQLLLLIQADLAAGVEAGETIVHRLAPEAALDGEGEG